MFDFALEWGIPAVPEADDAAFGVELRALADPQDGEVGCWVEVEVPETVEELLTDAVVKEFRVRTERDQLILKWHGCPPGGSGVAFFGDA